MNLKKEILIYKQNFRFIYKDQTLRLILNNYLSNIESMISNHGIRQTIIFHKEILRFMQQSCLNQRTTFAQNIFWTKTRNGIPTFLIKGVKNFDSRLMKDIRFKQGLLTICNFYKVLKAPVSYDVSTITKENLIPSASRYDELIEKISSHFGRFIKARGIEPFKLNSSQNPVFVTPKASANGSNAIGYTSVLDAIASQETNLREVQSKMADLVYSKKAFNRWTKLFDDSLIQGEEDIGSTKKTGRLHFLQEGGGKTRVICIPDIWSQTALKPIHDYLMNVLKRFPCDGTFSHSLIAKRVRKYTRTGWISCYDLRAATDRMPVDLQKAILEKLLGEDLSAVWKTLLTEREFSYPGGELRYAVGQPMGFLSSWASMAITHHAIINYAKNDKSFYAVIGDDMAIASKIGAQKYQNILNELGMEISKEKSVTSSDNNFVGEIAKRLFINGAEISPIPAEILIKSTGNLINFQEFIRVFSERFHHSDPGGFSDSEYHSILEQLFQNSKFKDDYDAHVLLSCPVLDQFPILPDFPRLSTIRNPWRTGPIKRRLLSDLERFLLETANKRTNQKVMELDPSFNPSAFVESTKKRKSPLYNLYKIQHKKDLLNVIRKINTTYIDEEADSFAEGPMSDIRDILSYPNPLNNGVSEIYLSKRKLRLRNTNSLIQQFLDKNPFYRNPDY